MQFFGCWGQAGHYVYDPGGRQNWRANIIDADTLDGVYPPNIPGEPEAAMSYVVFGQIRIIAMWDRSTDSRGKSNAAFVADQPFSFEEMLNEAVRLFPEITGRLKAFAEMRRLGILAPSEEAANG